MTGPVPLSTVRSIVFPAEAAAHEEYGRLDRFGLLPPASIQWVISPGMFDKSAITAAVQYSRYFAETAWAPPVPPAAAREAAS